MLGPKEICGLIVLLCFTLAQSSPSDCNCSCEKILLRGANELKDELKSGRLASIPKYAAAYEVIAAPLPECKGHSQKETRGLIYAFYTLFQQLNQTVPLAAEMKSLPTNLRQQKECLDYWEVSSSHISIANKETGDTQKKVFLAQSIKRYHCLMQRLLNETSADAAEVGK